MKNNRVAAYAVCAAAVAAAALAWSATGNSGWLAPDNGRGDGSAASSGYTAESIRVGYFPAVGHAIPIIGMERGIFDEHMPGVRVEPKIFDSGPQAVESMFAGSIDIAYVGPGPALNAFLNSENGRIRILSGAASGGTSFVAHPGSASGDRFDFAHKRVAAPQIGNTQDVSLRHHIAGQGLETADKGGSVVVYNIPNPDIVTLFVKGEIDGAWVPEPWATILVEEHGGLRLFYEESMWPDGKFATVLLIADMAYARDHPDVISAWLDAHDNAAKVINSDKDAAGVEFNEFLQSHFGQRLDGSVVNAAVHNTLVTTDPLVDTVYEFAERADRLGYMGRGEVGSRDLSGLFSEYVAGAEAQTPAESGPSEPAPDSAGAQDGVVVWQS